MSRRSMYNVYVKRAEEIGYCVKEYEHFAIEDYYGVKSLWKVAKMGDTLRNDGLLSQVESFEKQVNASIESYEEAREKGREDLIEYADNVISNQKRLIAYLTQKEEENIWEQGLQLGR